MRPNQQLTYLDRKRNVAIKAHGFDGIFAALKTHGGSNLKTDLGFAGLRTDYDRWGYQR